jgi:tRNA/rRNA methyltransferase
MLRIIEHDFSRPTPMTALPVTRFVLVGASHPGNIGAAARAMRVMGFADLVLVAPRDPAALSDPEAVSRASGATDVLAAARDVVCATAMTPRDFGPPTHAPRAFFDTLRGAQPNIAFVFGSERFGLANDEVYRSHACLSIPTDPSYGSLNLAQAVQLIAYDWRQALGGFDVVVRTAPPETADAAAVQGLLVHWEQALITSGFLDPAAPKKLMPRLNQLFNRARVTREEVDILRGIARTLAKQR